MGEEPVNWGNFTQIGADSCCHSCSSTGWPDALCRHESSEQYVKMSQKATKSKANSLFADHFCSLMWLWARGTGLEPVFSHAPFRSDVSLILIHDCRRIKALRDQIKIGSLLFKFNIASLCGVFSCRYMIIPWNGKTFFAFADITASGVSTVALQFCSSSSFSGLLFKHKNSKVKCSLLWKVGTSETSTKLLFSTSTVQSSNRAGLILNSYAQQTSKNWPSPTL